MTPRPDASPRNAAPRRAAALRRGAALRRPVVLSAISLALGCGGGPAAVPGPAVDPAAAAAQALERFDADRDGRLAGPELAASPPLAALRDEADQDRDQALTAAEIDDFLSRLFVGGSHLLSVECLVTWRGRPLGGATVRLQPAELLGAALPPAEGVTDDRGIARPAVAAEHLPADLRGVEAMMPGLYAVSITHPQIELPAAYRENSPLGCCVNPRARAGTALRFDLKLNP